MTRVIRARPVGSENRTGVICEICGLNEIYYNLSVFVYPACPVGRYYRTGVAPEDGTGVTLWLHYYES